VRSSPGSAAWWKAGWTRNVVRQCVAAGGVPRCTSDSTASASAESRLYMLGCVEAGPVAGHAGSRSLTRAEPTLLSRK
jgi:hypothetical protein